MNGGRTPPPFGVSGGGCSLCREVFSAEKTGIKRPCPRTYHCCANAERRQNDRDPGVTGMSNGDPQFDYGNERSHDWSPEAREEKYAG